MNIRSIATLFLFSFFGVWAAAQDVSVHWETNFDTAIQKAEQTNRPLFVHFVGDNCQPAVQMDREVFTNPAVVAGLNADFIPVRINAAEQQNLTQRFNVQAIPTDLIVKSNGQLLHRRQGGISGERFTQYLTFIKNSVMKPVASQQYIPVATAALVPAATVVPPAPTQTSPVVPAKEQGAFGTESLQHDPFIKTATQLNPIRVGADNTTSAAQAALVPTAPAQNVAPAAPAAPAPSVSRQGFLNATGSVSGKVSLPEIVETPKKVVEVPLALEGFCPVSLSIEEKWIPGNPAFCTMYQGTIFRFASAEALNAFTRTPTKYVPAAMGEDVVLLVDRNKRVSGNRKFGAVFQERVFLFASQETRDTFYNNPEFYTEIAIKYETANKDRHLPVAF